MNDNDPNRDDRKAMVKAGWLLGATGSGSVLLDLVFLALPFLCPQAADKVAGKVDDMLQSMAYPNRKKEN